MVITNGWKTYAVCVITILYAVTAAVLGKIDMNAAMQLILGALTAAGLRHGITTEAKKP